jgi:putative ABC transport system ATP-binding protein
MIELERVHFRYPTGSFALHVEELRVAAGERLALIGPSGSGKTTLLHLVAGIQRAQEGTVTTRGVEVAELAEDARRSFRASSIGLVFQEFELLEYLSVLDNVLLPYYVSGGLHLDAEVRERAADLAREVGLGDKLGRLPARLSQGERQRVAVCRALVTGPPLLLADEPTGNLDPLNKGKVLDILLEQAERSGATVVTVTHDHDLLPRFERVLDVKDFYDSTAEDVA